jgi:hypothetical protein
VHGRRYAEAAKEGQVKKRWRQERNHVRDRYVVDLTPALEEAFRKAGTQEPAVTGKDGAPMYCVCISAEARVAMLSTVPPLDNKETCPSCGSRDFEATTIGYMPWVPDPNKRTCRCGAKWRLCGNDLPVLEAS